MSHRTPRRKCFSALRTAAGFTLIELIVVMAIILLLAGIALPAYLNQAQQASGTAVYSNLIHAYQAEKSVSLGVDGKGSGNGFGTFNTGSQVVSDIVSSEPELTSTFEGGGTPYAQASIAAGEAAICPALASGSTAAADTAYDSSTLLAIQEVAASGQSYVLIATNTGAAPVISGVSGLTAGTNIVSGSCTNVGANVNVGSTATVTVTPFIWSGMSTSGTAYGLAANGTMYDLTNATGGTSASSAVAFAEDGPYVWTGMNPDGATTAYGITANGTEYELTDVTTGEIAAGSVSSFAADGPYVWTGLEGSDLMGITAAGQVYDLPNPGDWASATTATVAANGPYIWTGLWADNDEVLALKANGTAYDVDATINATAASSTSAFAADS